MVFSSVILKATIQINQKGPNEAMESILALLMINLLVLNTIGCLQYHRIFKVFRISRILIPFAV